MTQNTSTRQLIERLVQQSGIKKKLAAEILHVIPEIIEEGLKQEGEVRVKGLGTFRMKWTKRRIGRNPKTGESVEIPPHNRLVFLPEQSLKEYINRDFRLLSYKVIPNAEPQVEEEQVIPEYEPVIEPESLFIPDSVAEAEPEAESEAEPEAEPEVEAEAGPKFIEEPPEEIDYDYEPEPVVVKRRRVHWIIPVALSAIVILSLIFYLRNFYPSRQQPAVSSQQSAISDQQSADSIQNSELITHNSELRTHNSELRTQNSELITQNSKLITQHSELRTQNSEGKHLFQLARESYGNPLLWVLIYKENQDKITNPDVVISGRELVIPELEGRPDKLSHNDSINVADGYRMVYEFYLEKGDSRAEDFKRASQLYRPD